MLKKNDTFIDNLVTKVINILFKIFATGHMFEIRQTIKQPGKFIYNQFTNY